jgi:hypothetical protein
MAEDEKVPFLGSIPLDPRIGMIYNIYIYKNLYQFFFLTLYIL